MDPRPLIEFPLDLPNVRVLGTELSDKGELIIRVESTLQGAICRRCGAKIDNFHGYDTALRLRHLPVLNRRVYIELRPKRYRCFKCEGRPTTTQRCSWYEPQCPHTRAFEESMLLELINATVQDVAAKHGVGYDAIEGMLQRHVESQIDWDEIRTLGLLGLDEIALKKGHDNYVLIISTRLEDDTVMVLAVLEDRKKATLLRWLRSIPKKLRDTVAVVCIDMHKNYAEAVAEVLPEAQIVADRFHVARAYRDGADALRKTELRRLKQQLPKDEYAKLQGAMWAFRRNRADTEPEHRAVLKRLFEHSPALKRAYQLREQLTAIFDRRLSKRGATLALQRWQDRVRRSGLRCFDAFLTTLNNWFEPITNYFLHRENSGFIEGLNNKIKVIKRRCYGLFNVSNLFRRIHLDIQGYARFSNQ